MAIAIVVAACLNAAASSWVLSTTFTNPTPEPNELFGSAMSMVGETTIAVGAPQVHRAPDALGEVYLYSTNGLFLTTLTVTNSAHQLGGAVFGLDHSRVIVGAKYGNESNENAGTAFLFLTNGNMLTTFTNPTPTLNDNFGLSAIAVGRDSVVIGAPFATTAHGDSGAAYLFDTNGTLRTTYTNPTAGGYSFGWSLAELNEETLVIGAPSDKVGSIYPGATYLVHTNGTILVTYTNPTPETDDNFGISVAAVGKRAVLIGASRDDAGAEKAGAAYLFATNGTLLTTITNPTPEPEESFGVRVATVGDNILLIAAGNDMSGVGGTGSVYVYDSQGNLLTTIARPCSSGCGQFGYGLAGYKSGKVLIGAYASAVGGAAYLYNLTSPIMQIRNATSNRVSISWEPELPGFALQESPNGPSLIGWTNSPSGTNNPATISIGNESKFFRLTKP